MKHILIIVIVVLFWACGNKSKPYVENYDWEKDTASLVSDEVKDSHIPPPPPPDDKRFKRPPPPHTKSRTPHEPDNMRGFDPASEDDMEDNGMSRYMENTDDEGWD